MRLRREWVIPSVACVMLAGCGVHEFRSETILHPDGSIERAIYQPQEATPDAAQNRKLWQQTTWAGEIRGDRWTGSIRELPVCEGPVKNADGSVKRPAYFAAWGQFDSVAKLPETFAREIDVGDKRSVKLTRRYERVDYGFVIEHRWSERLNDIVRLDDMRQARRELFDLLSHIGLEILSMRFKETHDLSRLKTWLRDDGFPWFEDAVDLWYDWAAQRTTYRGDPRQLERNAQRRLVDLCARHGLKLPEPADKYFDDARVGDAIRKFAADKLPELIRQRDGEPLDKETTQEVLIWLGLADRPENRDANQESPLELLTKRVKDTQYGGHDVFEERTAKLALRIHGEFGGFKIPENFHYSMTMPGLIVETSGELIAADQTAWEFESAAAFPWGLEMSCRSLDVDAERTKVVLKGHPLETLAARRDLVRELSADAPLAAAIRQAAKEGTLKPLQAHAAGENLDESARSRLRRLQKLLKLDPR